MRMEIPRGYCGCPLDASGDPVHGIGCRVSATRGDPAEPCVFGRGGFDVARFYEALDNLRHRRRLRWREVVRQSHVSPSTLSRLGDGKKPDADTLGKLIAWMRDAVAGRNA